MAKKNNAGVIAAKKRDNRVKVLQCSTKDCENEFYIAMPEYPSVRKCYTCFLSEKSAPIFLHTSTGSVVIGRALMKELMQ